MIGTMVRLAALVTAIGVATAHDASAENVSIYQATLAESGQKTQDISTEQMRKLVAEGKTLILDTRTRAEFDAGHIPGATNLDVRPDALIAAVETLAKGDKSAAMVLYCNGPYCQASRRLADQLVGAGFSNVRRYQLGMPVWRALGGPTAVELDGIDRILKGDKTAVFIDARSAEDFAKATVPGAVNAPLDDLAAGKLKKVPLPEDDFNRRIVLFGGDAAQARKMAEMLSTRPWHNVTYYPGSFDTLAGVLKTKP
jgi:rhodanese-related sulfurtransferase